MTNGRGAELDLWLAAEVVDALPRALEPIGPSARASLIGLHPRKFVHEPPAPLSLVGQDQIHHVEIPLAVIGMRFDVQEGTTIRREDRSDVRSDRAEPRVLCLVPRGPQRCSQRPRGTRQSTLPA